MPMSIEERLDDLERASRRLHWLIVALFALSVPVLALGSAYGVELGAIGGIAAAALAAVASARARTRIPRIVRAHKLEVVGDRGNVVVAFGETSSGDGAMVTYDSQGRAIEPHGVDPVAVAAAAVEAHHHDPPRRRSGGSREPAAPPPPTRVPLAGALQPKTKSR